jgi:hypothetical protein
MELGKVVSRRFLERVLEEYRAKREKPQHVEFGEIKPRRGFRASLFAVNRK